MISEDKKAGACAAVLILMGVDQIAYLIAGFQLGAESFWWLRVGVIVALLFFGWHLLTSGPRFARIAAALLIALLCTRFFILLSVFRTAELAGFVLPAVVNIVTVVALLRLPSARH